MFSFSTVTIFTVLLNYKIYILHGEGKITGGSVWTIIIIVVSTQSVLGRVLSEASLSARLLSMLLSACVNLKSSCALSSVVLYYPTQFFK